jgi:hypothetical protein
MSFSSNLWDLCALCGKTFLLISADLPADALGAILTIPLGVDAGAAFLAVPLVIFLADGKGFPFWMVDTIHGFGFRL